MKTRFVRHKVGPSCGEAPHGGNSLSVIQRGARIRLDCFVTGSLPELGLHFCDPEKHLLVARPWSTAAYDRNGTLRD